MFSLRHTRWCIGKQRIRETQRSICCFRMDVRKVPRRRRQDNDGKGSSEEAVDECSSLPVLGRLYVYALHGCLCELVFTAAWDWCSTRDQRMVGHSSLWALPMYSGAIYVIERLRIWLLSRHQQLPVRLLAYTAFIYLWEFSWGAGLLQMEACPWDYSGFKYNLGGLVTLEYALPWTVAAFLAEHHVIRNTLRIRLHD